MIDEMERLTRRFLDGDLDPGEEREVLHHLAEDEEARALLRLDLGIRRTMAERPPFRVPGGFTDRVMAELEAREGAAPDPRGPLATLWAELRRPRTLRWRPAHALLAAAALLLLASAVVLGGGITASSGPLLTLGEAGEGAVPENGALAAETALPGEVARVGPDTVFVRFVLEAETAGSVAVAGDFNRWEPVPLHRTSRDGPTVWSGLVAVPRGEHRYMFVIDGTSWVTDPLAAAYSDDGFGNRNAILSL